MRSPGSSRSLRPRSGASPQAGLALWVLLSAGCLSPPSSAVDETPGTDQTVSRALSGANQGGANLAGVNLAGSNLAGVNLGGPNMGGNNLAGVNQAGNNLAGTNLGGNNLGGNNLADTNLGGANLAGVNLAGVNLTGVNLVGSNLAGSNLAGSNTGGNDLAGVNLTASNLAGSSTGSNIHGRAGPVDGMLYSGEDLWMPRTGQCIVMGIGSVAFARLLGQQSPGARISVALGKLPWGFKSGSGVKSLDAWEAVVWGDRTYCSFVLTSPAGGTSWAGVAGFIKAIFRWQAPPSQTMDTSGIEASAVHDSTVQTSISSHKGMMDAGARVRAGTITEKAFVAGQMAFISATTNNQPVTVDFASWVKDRNNNGLVLGNVQVSPPPTYSESVYIALDNGNGTVDIFLDDAKGMDPGSLPQVIHGFRDLDDAYGRFLAGQSARPEPRRCGGALYLEFQRGLPVPPGKCDNGLVWTGTTITGSQFWSAIAGTTAPFNSYMNITRPGGLYRKSTDRNPSARPVLSETYVHMWEPAYSFSGPWPTVTASGGVAPEDASRLFDNDVTTKWFSYGSRPWVMYAFTTPTHAVTSYKVGSANDVPGRDPTGWVLEGSNDGLAFHALDTRSNESFASRKLLRSYTVARPGSYQLYRFRVTASANLPDFQMSELQLLEGRDCVAESNGALCARLGKSCGTVTAADNCGVSRTVSSCGMCIAPQTCGGSGTTGICGPSQTGAGNCGAAAWSSSANYASGSIATAACTAQFLDCSAPEVGQRSAWRCIAADVSWCRYFQPGSGANYLGVWSQLEPCD